MKSDLEKKAKKIRKSAKKKSAPDFAMLELEFVVI